MDRPKQQGKVSSDFFTLPHPGLMGLVLIGLYFMTMATFAPTSVPSFFGPLATFVRYMGVSHPVICKLISVGCVIIHVFEARIARTYCRKLKLTEKATILWTLSTFIFGYPSLMRIEAAYKRK